VTPEQFLFHEAQLLDTQRFEEWLALFTEDATYWVPLEQNQKDPHQTSSLIYDDRTLLELRVKQFRHPRAHARAPLARTVHQVGNIVVDDLTIRSTQTVIEFRNEKQRLWAGLVEHQLRRERDSFRIARKRIDLVNSEGEIEGISILL
jgi:3-phenylpropionate/cinnamic acid dioxygenase small subunit